MNHELLRKGDTSETIFALGKIILNTLGCGIDKGNDNPSASLTPFNLNISSNLIPIALKIKKLHPKSSISKNQNAATKLKIEDIEEVVSKQHVEVHDASSYLKMEKPEEVSAPRSRTHKLNNDKKLELNTELRNSRKQNAVAERFEIKAGDDDSTSAAIGTVIEVNQIGTVTEAIEIVKMAKDAQWDKSSAPCRGERLAKYNQFKVNLPDDKSKIETTKTKIIDLGITKDQVVIFVPKIELADMLYDSIREYHFHASVVHRDLTKQERKNMVNNFYEMFTQILITTDLKYLNEGTIPYKVDMVVNFDIPVKRDSLDEPDINLYLLRLPEKGWSVAAGPVGRVLEADLRAGDRGSGMCYTYSCSKGAFVGVSLEGNIVATRMDTNLHFYGDPYLTTGDILLGTVDRPKAAEPLRVFSKFFIVR
ncbi:Ysc84 actin-binding domain-containing protein [Tanacetum coccineum]